MKAKPGVMLRPTEKENTDRRNRMPAEILTIFQKNAKKTDHLHIFLAAALGAKDH
jgi:hypothetical protein